MDEYGTFRATPEDWDALAMQLTWMKPIIFPYSADGEGAFIIALTPHLHKFGVFPFFGRYGITDLLVTVVGKGGFWFEFYERPRPYDASYVGPKLNLGLCDAAQITELLNELSRRVNNAKENCLPSAMEKTIEKNKGEANVRPGTNRGSGSFIGPF